MTIHPLLDFRPFHDEFAANAECGQRIDRISDVCANRARRQAKIPCNFLQIEVLRNG